MEFIETIKVVNGKMIHPEIHLKRMQDTAYRFFNKKIDFSAALYRFRIPVSGGLSKCRIVYNSNILDISITPYLFKKIESLKLIENNTIDYQYKYYDRSVLNSMVQDKDSYDDILISVNGNITDTSFSNVVFSDETGYYTPKTFLLNGTKRQLLLSQGIIGEREIRTSDIKNYHSIHLINAMMELEDHIEIPTSGLILQLQ